MRKKTAANLQEMEVILIKLMRFNGSQRMRDLARDYQMERFIRKVD